MSRNDRRVDPARLAAFEVLKAVRVDDAYANLVLPHALATHGLSGRDAAFATELASGTLRQQGTYDAVLAACIDRPLSKVEAKVRDALRLGCHQLLSMRVPDHAAINSTVELVKSKVGPGAASFTNAVLRKVATRSLEEWVDELAPAPGVARDALEFSHPAWIVDLLAASLRVGPPSPPNGAELRRLLAADNAAPRVTLVARPGRATVAELVDLGAEPTMLSPYGAMAPAGSLADLAPVRERRAGVQDEGSQLVALAAADAPVDGPDERWLDLCAGPGGKSALLAALAAQRGATLLANEAQFHRARLVAQNLTGAEGVAGVVTGDGARPPYRSGSFDRVLVDAPCSGLGALRRRPESRWRRTATDIDELVPLQVALLSSALDLVRPGGAVLYATCSPVLAETSEVVDAVFAARTDVTLEPLGGLVGDIAESAGPVDGTVQLWPHRHQTDAMFMALLRRLPTMSS
ncbi:RsmB/NOP family class I SAM-dependent RNA methyltransferase [Nocardioides sp. Kera G14]|uniref:RsmB/NOP family class I SAM-dependent RNA methyltransferase n=1 Tax=Nocardioides sp. Kera G14 TaxID=2884264 RepID=UPI001D0FE90A|nr:transcription antitermination factor NusB [Nocardioides sp. Kera G14]UDY25312.1 rRNA cytosine-C5-methyltransferase [Nocardioides sp. Kera G14]